MKSTRFETVALAGIAWQLILASCCGADVNLAPGTYIVGADMSYVQQREGRGVKYSENGTPLDVFQILKNHGFNYIRFRVFNDPTRPNQGNARAYSPQGYCDLPHTIVMAKRVKALGFSLLVDFHYSDGWADPGKQYAPAAWAKMPPSEAVKALHDWTKDAIAQLKAAGAEPDMVQVGNEITPGMMTDLGGTTRNWPQLAAYLKAGISAVREVDPKIQIMLHIDKGGDNRATRTWVDAALAQGVQFDVLGLSCYSRWQGPPAAWKANFEDLAARYPKLKFVMAEVDAQAVEANDIMKGLPREQGLGTFIWEPTASNANQQLFDDRGAVLPARMSAYDRVTAKYQLKKLSP
jgi:arabinogalactan endo-1,4-beta-galactosidase